MLGQEDVDLRFFSSVAAEDEDDLRFFSSVVFLTVVLVGAVELLLVDEAACLRSVRGTFFALEEAPPTDFRPVTVAGGATA